jgi:hypothetical protein
MAAPVAALGPWPMAPPVSIKWVLELQKDAPLHRAVQRPGAILAIPIMAGLHHQYVRI